MPALTAPIRLLGRGLDRYLRRLGRATEVIGLAESERHLDAIRARFPGRRLIFCYRIRDVLSLALLRHACHAVRLLEDVVFVCDDTVGGRLSEELITAARRPVAVLRWSRRGVAGQDIQGLIRSSSPLGITIDGHGPYGEVNPGLTRLIARCTGVAVPLVVCASRSFSVRMRAPLAVPRARTSLAPVLGDPVDCAWMTERTHRDLAASFARAEARSLRRLDRRPGAQVQLADA